MLTSEQLVCAVSGDLRLFDPERKKWESSTQITNVELFQSLNRTFFRIRGQRAHDSTNNVDLQITSGLDYRATSDRFHQWQFDGKRYGLHFSDSDDAKRFSQWISALCRMSQEVNGRTEKCEISDSETLSNNNSVTPPPPTAHQGQHQDEQQPGANATSCEVCSANLTKFINREAGSTSPVGMAAHENPKLSQEEEREHLTTFFTNRINELTAEREKLRCDKDAKEDEYKGLLKKEQAQVDTLFYENCQFRQQIKQLKQQLLDSESKYNDLLIQYNERDDSEYDTEYSTDSEDYTDESEEESSCESCSDDDVDTVKIKVAKFLNKQQSILQLQDAAVTQKEPVKRSDQEGDDALMQSCL